MAELRKCSRCRSEIELKYFGINRKGERNKTCESCLNKTRAYQQTPEFKACQKNIKQLRLCVIIVVAMLIKAVFQYIKEDFIVKFITWKLNQVLKNG